MNFIKTRDADTALKLKGCGFTELPKEGEYFVFLNDGNKQFVEDKNIVYTNKLYI